MVSIDPIDPIDRTTELDLRHRADERDRLGRVELSEKRVMGLKGHSTEQ